MGKWDEKLYIKKSQGRILNAIKGDDLGILEWTKM
jgi:hypothetical protein